MEFFRESKAVFENILVCLDGSNLSEAILPYIATIAERFHSKVVLLNVIIVPTFLVGVGKTEIEPSESIQLIESEEKVYDYLEDIAETWREKGLDVECVTVEGTIEESIITYARTFKISLIALATHDRGVLSRLIVKSTTDLVLRKSGIPVLAICPDNFPSFK
jgi:nucleotide-binding universal stress UspA family protein